MVPHVIVTVNLNRYLSFQNVTSCSGIVFVIINSQIIRTFFYFKLLSPFYFVGLKFSYVLLSWESWHFKVQCPKDKQIQSQMFHWIFLGDLNPLKLQSSHAWSLCQGSQSAIWMTWLKKSWLAYFWTMKLRRRVRIAWFIFLFEVI